MRTRTLHLLAGIVALLTIAVYLPALGNGFVQWDDEQYVTGNLHIRSMNAAFFKWAVGDLSVNYWHPLTWLSHAVDYKLWGLNPLGHHLTNILLHGANTFLVVWIIAQLLAAANATRLRSGRLRALPERTLLIAAGATGILFGIHPLHVESVAWVSERKDLLCALFFLLGVLAYLYRFGVRPDAAGPAAVGTRTGRRFSLLSILCFVLALASKPMAVTFPFVLLLLDWHPLGRLSSRRDVPGLLREKLPFFVLSLLAAVAAFVAQYKGGAVVPLSEGSLSVRILEGCQALVAYLGKMVIPLRLLPYYEPPRTFSTLSLRHLSAALAVAGCTAWLLVRRNRYRTPAAAWSYYLITLLPVLGLVRVGSVILADRFTYLPSLGPFLLLGLACGTAYERIDALPGNKESFKALLTLSAVLLCIGLGALTVKQIAVWKDRLTLWNDVVEKGDRAPFALVNRGAALADRGLDEQAVADFSEAIDREPGYADAYNNRGLALRRLGRLEDAVRDFDAAIALRPEKSLSYVNRGMTFHDLGVFDRALEDLSLAISRKPSDAGLLIERGEVYRDMQNFGKAIDDFTRALALDPLSMEAYINRGLAFKHAGRFDRAIADYDAAIGLQPTAVEAYINRGVAYKHLGQYERALADYGRAIELDPSRSLAYMNRGVVYRRIGRPERARQDFLRACELGSREGCLAAGRPVGRPGPP